MKTLTAFITIFILTTSSFALDIDPDKGPGPLVVLLQTNPWAMVIGSDTPRLVIYEDGQVIYAKDGKGDFSQYLHVQLPQEKLNKIKKKLLSFGDYTRIKRQYNIAPNAFDLPETKIYLHIDTTQLVTNVYGLMLPKTELVAFSSFSSDQQPDSLPESLKNLYSYLSKLSFKESKKWIPHSIEVMISPYEYAPDESIHWPQDWPGLASPNTLTRQDSYSIFLPGSEMQKLEKFLQTRKERGAVEIEGKKWAVALRSSFPGEPVWSKAFQENQQE